MVRICFVCLGNICRSPTAEGVMRHLAHRDGLAERVHCESAGTEGWHQGEPADERTRRAARARGIDLTAAAQQFRRVDFARFDYVVAMDRANRRVLEKLAPDAAARGKVHLLRAFDAASPADADVPDPYYGGPAGFEEVLDLCEAACRGLLEHLRAKHGL